MRYIEIDGKRFDVEGCRYCPMYVNRMDEGMCKYPGHEGLFDVPRTGCKSDCPLRTNLDMAEGGFIGPSTAEAVFLDPPESSEDREAVVPESVLKGLEEAIKKSRITWTMSDDKPRVATIECEWMERTLSEMADLAENIEIAVENGELVMQGIFMERLKNMIDACHNDMIGRRIEMELKK